MRDLHIRPRQLTESESARLGDSAPERLRVLDPATRRALPTDGGAVVSSSYWARRLRCGDVEVVSTPEPRSRKKASSSSKKEI